MVPSSSESLSVDPSELRVAAARLDAHGEQFQRGHQRAHSQAGQVRLGSGLAGAALTGMLSGWEADGDRYGKHFVNHAEDHRGAANVYERTDGDSASYIGDAASGL
ncbi:WXG100 family type VII secretion target [Mycobacteroides abscessus]|uniref:WXG100 family type VII secretion target n=1 Tax=Mycobacteroides abscessus TaxID=36809 RepID=UPI0028072EB3|nr:type VII secretion target [Mycobacteroides abscessus]MDQ8118529.1 type VII secretion target [Mycobacteroides abscessus subsp. massiliense]